MGGANIPAKGPHWASAGSDFIPPAPSIRSDPSAITPPPSCSCSPRSVRALPQAPAASRGPSAAPQGGPPGAVVSTKLSRGRSPRPLDSGWLGTHHCGRKPWGRSHGPCLESGNGGKPGGFKRNVPEPYKPGVAKLAALRAAHGNLQRLQNHACRSSGLLPGGGARGFCPTGKGGLGLCPMGGACRG